VPRWSGVSYQKYIMGMTMPCCSINPCHIEQPSCSIEKMKCRGRVGTGVRKRSKMLHLIYSIYGELVYYVWNVFIVYWMGVTHVLDGCFPCTGWMFPERMYEGPCMQVISKSIPSAYLCRCQLYNVAGLVNLTVKAF